MPREMLLGKRKPDEKIADMSASSSPIIRWIRFPSIVEKEIRIQLGIYCVEKSWPSVESKKIFQVISGTCVGKPERALSKIQNPLDEPQDAAEVMGSLVIDVVQAGRNSARRADGSPCLANKRSMQ